VTAAPEPARHAAGEAAARALEGGTAARQVARDVLEVSGPEAASYLQGQCSQDLAALAPGDSTETLVLSPQGKVDAYLRVTRTADDTFVLDGDAGCGPDARARLERFRLRTKVDITSLDWVCLALRGPGAPELTPPGPPVLALPVSWPGWSGVDLLGPPPPGDPELESWLPPGAVRCPAEPWEAARIEAGVPVGGREVTSATIAAEVGLVERTVSFTKGCFTGQELVARLDARGSNVARHLSGLVVDGGSRPPVGATVWTSDGAHEVGSISSVAYSTRRGATVALATLHRRVGPGDGVHVRWDGGDASGDVRSLPFVTT
jgi:folate-binding protein YgfZ